MKDHEISILINRLVEVAKIYHNTQQLREQIAGLILPALKETLARAIMPDNEHKWKCTRTEPGDFQTVYICERCGANHQQLHYILDAEDPPKYGCKSEGK